MQAFLYSVRQAWRGAPWLALFSPLWWRGRWLGGGSPLHARQGEEL